MDIGIGSIGAGQMLPTQPAGAPAAPAEAPAGSDVERLQSALADAQPQAEAQPAAQEAAPPDVSAAQPNSGPASMGDRILNGMSSLSDKIQTGRAEAAAVLEKPEMTHTDLLRANMALMETGTIVSAASKTAEKITQGIKTLQQG